VVIDRRETAAVTQRLQELYKQTLTDACLMGGEESFTKMLSRCTREKLLVDERKSS